MRSNPETLPTLSDDSHKNVHVVKRSKFIRIEVKWPIMAKYEEWARGGGTIKSSWHDFSTLIYFVRVTPQHYTLYIITYEIMNNWASDAPFNLVS